MMPSPRVSPRLARPDWPPALEPGERIVLEGRSSMRKFLSLAAVIVLGMILVVIALDWVIGRAGGDRGLGAGGLLWVVVLMTGFNFWMVRRTAGWMLTSRRFLQQGRGEIPRSEIGDVRLRWGESVVVHRAGGDELLKGARFSLDYLDDPRGVRDALERLK